MKKRKLRIVALMLLVALIIPCYANAGDGEAQKDKMLTDEEQYELMLKQAPAMAAYEQLMAAWSNGVITVYPEAFGGFYHTDDFKLAIKVVNNDERFIAEVLEIIDNSDVIKFVETDISINELVALQKSICEEYSSLKFSSGIDQMSSSVNISFLDRAGGARQNAPALIKLASIPHVTISIESEPAKMQSVSYNPGRMIFGTASSPSAVTGVGTLGWYGTYSFPNRGRVACFLTAGHVQIAFERKQQDMYFGNTKVFSKDDYPLTLYGNRNCVTVCGDGRTTNLWPMGDSDGDFAALACISTSVSNANIQASTNLYIGSGQTLKVTDYFGSDKRWDILNGEFDPLNASAVKEYSNTIFPGNTMVAKGWGVGGPTNAYGTIVEIFATYDYNNYYDEETGAHNYEAINSEGNIYGCTKIKPRSGSLPFTVSGDSGAPVYYVGGNNTNNTVSLLGIVSGGKSSYTYITPTTVMLGHGFIPVVASNGE